MKRAAGREVCRQIIHGHEADTQPPYVVAVMPMPPAYFFFEDATWRRPPTYFQKDTFERRDDAPARMGCFGARVERILYATLSQHDRPLAATTAIVDTVAGHHRPTPLRHASAGHITASNAISPLDDKITTRRCRRTATARVAYAEMPHFFISFYITCRNDGRRRSRAGHSHFSSAPVVL